MATAKRKQFWASVWAFTLAGIMVAVVVGLGTWAVKKLMPQMNQ